MSHPACVKCRTVKVEGLVSTVLGWVCKSCHRAMIAMQEIRE